MSLIPNTTCRRCHRQYPSFRSRCPYCGTKKAKEVRTPVPETDSAVPGTKASRSAAETMNLQMLIGGVLLVVVLVATIALVSVRVGRDVKDQKQVAEQQQAQTQTTAVPLPSATPTPTPTPAPEIQDMECRWGEGGNIDYIESGYFGLASGMSIDLYLTWYPGTIRAVPEWSVDDETIVTITPNGNECHCELIGESGTKTNLHIKVNEREETIEIQVL